MSITIEVIKNMVNVDDFKLVAGEKGICNVIRWVHMVENVEIASFIEGGEMVFVTGLGLSKENILLDLIKVVEKRGASGIVINVGPYIKQISQEIIDYCNEKKLPLFEVPWNVYMVGIMKQFCLAIGQSQKVQTNLSDVLKDIIFNKTQDEDIFETFERYGFKIDMHYTVSIIEFNTIDNNIQVIRDKIHYFLTRLHKEIITLETENRLVLLYAKYNDHEVKDDLEQLVKWYRVNGRGSKITNIAIGQQVKSLKGISKSYEEANKCLKFHYLVEEEELILLYSNLGIYKLVLAIENEEVINEFNEETLMPLIQYDKSKGSDLLLVLKYYIDSSGSVKSVSEKMFLHRNTINYKLKRIEEILECDLSDWQTRLILNMALILNKIH